MDTHGITVEALQTSTVERLDVRRAPTFAQARELIPGARWFDPASVDAWAATLPKGRPVVVYCVHGHEVGQDTAARLRALGVPARYLIGGIEAWRAAGLPLQPKGNEA